MNRASQIIGGVVLAFALVIAYESRGFEFFTIIGPGPGFLPIALSAILALLSLALIVEGTVKAQPAEGGDEGLPDRDGLRRIGMILAAMLASILLLLPLGFLIAGTLFLAFILIAVEGFGWLKAIAIALAAAGLLYVVFRIGLNVRLPIGPLGF